MNAPERSDYVCELGHALFRYYFDARRFGHQLLCPRCDADLVQRWTDAQPLEKREIDPL